MKVNDTKDIKPVSATQATSPVKPATAGEPADKVSVDQTRNLEQAIAAAKSSSGMERSARLQEIANSVKKGQYTPNASQIAERILSAAELEARIRAMFSR